ncbi:MAG: DUF3786 domain-containing protein [Candidatus Thorarchaeota archaeon]
MKGDQLPDDIYEYWMSLARELAHKFNIEQFDTSSEMWSWNNFGEDIQSLRNRLGFEDSIEIVGLKLNLETGETLDTYTNSPTSSSRIIPHLYYYSKAKDEGLGNEWVKFNTLRGSWACRFSFNKDDLNVLASKFQEDRTRLIDGLTKLGATKSDYGDFSYEIGFLPMVKVLLIFGPADEEFPASVRLLYDKNSIFYLPHEMLGNISWILVSRMFKIL